MLELHHKQAPVLSKAVGRAFPLGRANQTILSPRRLFTPCASIGSLLKTVAEAARDAASGEIPSLSPACSSSGQFRLYQHRGEAFRQPVKSIGWGVHGGTRYIHGS
jgi:UDP-N-acetylmuramoylalanine--D-glutamate ligase